MDVDLFTERLDHLEQRGLADDTLVVYTSDHGELLVLAGKSAASAKRRYVRRNALDALRAYARGGATEYGDPLFTADEAAQLLEQVATDAIEREEVALSDDAQQRLRNLGYT